MRQGEFVKGQPLPGTRYRVLELVGVGGMGSVYEVEHLELGKRFVLKALLSDLAMREDLVLRLRNEQRALGRLEHPNIVAVTDAGATSGNVPYFVMERLEGETLAQRLKRVRRLSPVEALRIASGVLEGLSAAHEIGVVHRDVKPPNIFLAAGNRPKILDFGVAKIADAGGAITARGVAVGTPRYMSPEQASGERVDGRSDLYAVGLLLFEMVAGSGPFDDARDANEMLLAHLGQVPKSLATVAIGVTPELAELVARLLAKDPAQRPADARAAAAAVRALERSYGSVVEADAPTPFASELPGRGSVPSPPPPPAPASTAATQEVTTHARRSQPPDEKDTLIDDRGSTLSGDTGYGTRTELLSAVAPLSSGAAETRTRVPVTPADGERTLEPLPMESRSPSLPPASPKRRLALALSLVGLLSLSSLLALALRERPFVVVDSAGESARVGASPVLGASPERSATLEARPREAATADAPRPTGAPSPALASARAMAPGAAGARAPARPSASPSIPDAPPVATGPAGLPGAGLDTERKERARSAKAPASAPKEPKPARVPKGLPGSGL